LLGEVIDGCLVEGGGFAQGCRVRSGEFGEPGAQDLVVDAGEEHGVPEAGAGDLVAVGVRDTFDEAVFAEPENLAMTSGNEQPSAATVVRELAGQCDRGVVVVSGAAYKQTCCRVWNSAVTSRPTVVIRARTREDVRAAVLAARRHELPLSVRAGGHDWAGRSLPDGGLVIDLTGMRQVTVNADEQVATGSSRAPYAALALAALRGRQAEASALIEATIRDVARRGEGLGLAVAERASAVLHNGLGSYAEAMAAAQRAFRDQHYPGVRHPGVANWAAAELIEAAARSGMSETAADAYHWIAEMTSASGTRWALGVEARSGALLAEGNEAEGLYQDSIMHLDRSRVRAELARAHLLYGEWLRRQRRRADAREQLRTAQRMLDQMGIDGFAERARRELRANGETARKRTAAARDEELTGQEAKIARLARERLSNPEIGTRLFISARTVQYHLGNIFAKLGIASRSQLSHVLP
jgi:ATP/maltotriose-dependent transcriptional regulator MalT